MHLQRITTEYVDAEDRLRLSGELPNGNTVVLWLTQRLLNRLISHLCQWLERQSPYQGQLHADILHTFQQQAAQAAHEPQAPVAAKDSGQLVHSVDIAHTPEVFQMTFKGDSGQQLARLGLPAQPLRQWLGIVHGQYNKAQWPTGVWPVWVEAAQVSVAPKTRSAVLH